MPSERKMKQSATAEWIALTADQTMELENKIEDLIAKLKAGEEFDGKGFYVRILESIKERLAPNRRISAKQLGTVQKGYARNFNEPLYVKGLEFYLLANEEKMAKIAKGNATRKAKREAKKVAE